MLKREGADVSYNDPYFPFVGQGCKYDLQMHSAPLDKLVQYDCVLIVSDHSAYDYCQVVGQAQLVVDAQCHARHRLGERRALLTHVRSRGWPTIIS